MELDVSDDKLPIKTTCWCTSLFPLCQLQMPCNFTKLSYTQVYFLTQFGALCGLTSTITVYVHNYEKLSVTQIADQVAIAEGNMTNLVTIKKPPLQTSQFDFLTSLLYHCFHESNENYHSQLNEKSVLQNTRSSFKSLLFEYGYMALDIFAHFHISCYLPILQSSKN